MGSFYQSQLTECPSKIYTFCKEITIADFKTFGGNPVLYITLFTTLYFFLMSRTRFRVNPHSMVD